MDSEVMARAVEIVGMPLGLGIVTALMMYRIVSALNEETKRRMPRWFERMDDLEYALDTLELQAARRRLAAISTSDLGGRRAKCVTAQGMTRPFHTGEATARHPGYVMRLAHQG